MSEISTTIIEELISFLDNQSEHVQKMIEFLDEFRKALIRRDLPVLQDMQTQLEQELEIRVQLDQSQRNLQRKLSGILECPDEEACLSALCRLLDSPLRETIQQRQRHLNEQILHLRQQHLSTELLLRECARMNRRFLEMIVGTDEKGKTYDAQGRCAWNTRQGLMSVKL